MEQEFICILARESSCEFRGDGYSSAGICKLKNRAKNASCSFAIEAKKEQPQEKEAE